MKKFLFISACLTLAFSACKKESSKTSTTASNTITATVGGSNVNFSTSATAEVVIDSGIYVLAVQGVTGTSSSAQSIIVGVLAQGPIVKGSYTINSTTNPNVTVIPAIDYTTSLSGNDGDLFETNIDFDIPNDNISTTTKVTITSISSTNVQGTFSGVLINDADGTSTETVANGKFNVAISTTKSLSSLSSAKMRSFKNRLRN
jgi:hypothetical protein